MKNAASWQERFEQLGRQAQLTIAEVEAPAGRDAVAAAIEETAQPTNGQPKCGGWCDDVAHAQSDMQEALDEQDAGHGRREQATNHRFADQQFDQAGL